MELLIDVLLDSVVDTAKLVPFLLATYLAMEAIEHSAGDRMKAAVERSGKLGPIIGGLLGGLPQCGFSAMAATLYSGRVVTVGTLVAVILSTSDEMIPVFLAHQEPVSRLAAIVLSKVALGVVVGLAVDAALHLAHREGDGHVHIHELCEREHCHCDDDDEGGLGPVGGSLGEKGEASHHHHHGHGLAAVVRPAIVHTVQVTAFIFLITLAFGLLIGYVGQDAVAALLGSHPVRATFLAALVGLIPNCGASVAIAELYLEGVLGSGPMMAGLLVSGGMGLLVLYRTNRDVRQNLLVTAFVYAVGVVVGLAVGAFGILF